METKSQDSSLFKVYKEYNTGKIDATKLIYKVEKELGIQTSSNFKNYMLKHPQGGATFSQVNKNLRVQNKHSDVVSAAVDPLDCYYHRGTAQKRVIVNDPCINTNQHKVTAAIRDYLSSRMSKESFKSQLVKYDVQIDEKMNTLIRRVEAGDTPTFVELGKHATRQMNGTSNYNRVDKINLNNDQIVQAQNSGKSFGFVDAKIDDEQHDQIHQLEQMRYLSKTYVPRKGSVNTRANQMQSSLGNVLNMDLAKQTGANRESSQSMNKNTSQQLNSAGNLINWRSERDIQEIFSRTMAFKNISQIILD